MITNFDYMNFESSILKDPDRLLQIENHKLAAKLHEEAARYHKDAVCIFENQIKVEYLEYSMANRKGDLTT